MTTNSADGCCVDHTVKLSPRYCAQRSEAVAGNGPANFPYSLVASSHVPQRHNILFAVSPASDHTRVTCHASPHPRPMRSVRSRFIRSICDIFIVIYSIVADLDNVDEAMSMFERSVKWSFQLVTQPTAESLTSRSFTCWILRLLILAMSCHRVNLPT